MALTKTYLGDNPDGTPHFNVTSDSKNPHFLITGPDTTGPMRAEDGTVYDVTPRVIEVASQKHAEQLAQAAEKDLLARGLHPAQKALEGADNEDEKTAAHRSLTNLEKKAGK